MAKKPQRPQAPAEPVRITLLIHDPQLLPRVDAWGAKNRRRNRSNAFECLVALALDAADRAEGQPKAQVAV